MEKVTSVSPLSTRFTEHLRDGFRVLNYLLNIDDSIQSQLDMFFYLFLFHF